MKESLRRIKSFGKSLKNLLGVGIYLLLVGISLEIFTIFVQPWLSFPVSIPIALQIAVTVLCALCSVSGIIWFNKTLNLIDIHFADGENSLVTAGPFNYVRHPLYATLLISLPPLFIIWFADILFVLPWVLMYAIAHFVIRIEERGLVKTFGNAYQIYRRFVPGLFPYKGAGGIRYRAYLEQVDTLCQP